MRNNDSFDLAPRGSCGVSLLDRERASGHSSVAANELDRQALEVRPSIHPSKRAVTTSSIKATHADERQRDQAASHVGHPHLGARLSPAAPDKRKNSKVSGARVTVAPATPLRLGSIAVAGLRRPHVDLRAANSARVYAQGVADATIGATSPSAGRLRTTTTSIIKNAGALNRLRILGNQPPASKTGSQHRRTQCATTATPLTKRPLRHTHGRQVERHPVAHPARAVLANDAVRGIVERAYKPPSRGPGTTYSRPPNGRPQRAEDPQPPTGLFKHREWATIAPAKQARAEPKQDGKTVTDAWGGRRCAPLGPKGRHAATSPVPWGQRRYPRVLKRLNAAIKVPPTPGDPTDTKSRLRRATQGAYGSQLHRTRSAAITDRARQTTHTALSAGTVRSPSRCKLHCHRGDRP